MPAVIEIEAQPQWVNRGLYEQSRYYFNVGQNFFFFIWTPSTVEIVKLRIDNFELQMASIIKLILS